MAIQANIILSICLSALMIYNLRKEIHRKLVKRLIIGSLPGLVVGIYVYLNANIEGLKILVGLTTLFVTVFLILNFTIQQSKHKDLLAGGLSGMLTTSIGVPVPSLLLYFSSTNIDQATLRSTTLAYYLFVYSISLVLQITFGGTTMKTWKFSAIALPALLGGIVYGQLLFQWMSVQTFRIITYIILIGTGLYLIMTSI